MECIGDEKMESKKEWKVRQAEILKLIKREEFTGAIRVPACGTQDATPGAYQDPMSGGVYEEVSDGYDPQPKSLGRWVGSGDEAQRYYSKRTTSGIMKRKQGRPHKEHKGQVILDIHAYDYAPEEIESFECEGHDLEPDGDYGLAIIRDAYTGWDETRGEVYVDTRWKRYLKLTADEKAEIEEGQVGDYGYVEEE